MRLDLVLVKLGAVFIVVYALGNLASYVTLIFSGSQSLLLSLFLFALVFMVPALIAWVLWSFPSMSVGSLYRDSDAAPAGAGDSSHVLLIGVSLIGVYTLVFGIIDLVYFEATRIAEKKLFADVVISGTPDTVAGRVTNILQIVFGLVLIYGRHGLATFLRQVRSAGNKHQRQAE